MIRPILRFHDLCAVIALLTLVVLHSGDFTSDPGVGWHLKTGEFVLTSHKPPIDDPFLALPFGQAPRRWVSDQWLSDVILFKAFALCGWEGLHALASALFFSGFFIVLYGSLRRSTGAPILSSLATIMAFKMAQVHFILRPVLFSIFLFIPVFAVARTLACAPQNSLRLAKYLWLLPLFVVWANLHPSFVLGLLWLGLGAAVSVVSVVSNVSTPITAPSEGARNRSWKISLVVLALPLAAFFATLLNPYGLDLHRSIVSLAGSDYFMNMHMEWLSPNFKSSEGSFIMVSWLVITLGIYIGAQTGSTVRLFDLLSVLLATWMTLRSIRTLPFFGIASAPALVIALQNLGHWIGKNFHTHTKLATQAWGRLNRREDRAHPFAFQGALVLILIFGAFIPALRFLPTRDRSPAGSGYPQDALQFLALGAAQSNPVVLYASPDLGGYITLQGFPQVRAVIDDRNTLLGESFYKEYFSARSTPKSFAEFLVKLGVTHLLLQQDSALSSLVSAWGGYKEIFRDKGFFVFEVPPLVVKET